jgi:hypothetical protein
MNDELEIELVEEWNYYDGFREGVLRIKQPGAFHDDGDLYHARAMEYLVENDEETRVEARSLFHVLYEALGLDLSGAIAEPPRPTFTYAEFYRKAPARDQGGDPQ